MDTERALSAGIAPSPAAEPAAAPPRMGRAEMRATAWLASISALRLFGLFVILPVFALYATTLPGGEDHARVGLAMGIYGLTQGALQIPFGWVSDRIGRRPVLYFGLSLFALGSALAAWAPDLFWVTVGRALQGAGAISGVVLACVADVIDERHRGKAMAFIGVTIGLTFAGSLALGPVLERGIGVPGIFALTGVLAVGALLAVGRVVPAVNRSGPAPVAFAEVIRIPALNRLNVGVFALHLTLMALFVVVPLMMRDAGLGEDRHWQVYLAAMIAAVVLMIPALVLAERRGKGKAVMLGGIALLLATQLVLGFAAGAGLALVVGALLAYFVAFNILEAQLPSMISRFAPAGARGSASGLYATLQFVGTFLGGAIGGWLYQHYGSSAVFAFCSVVTSIWLIAALGMPAAPPRHTPGPQPAG
ncbi:MAG: MFS transporter [Burkholderiales bacterium]